MDKDIEYDYERDNGEKGVLLDEYYLKDIKNREIAKKLVKEKYSGDSLANLHFAKPRKKDGTYAIIMDSDKFFYDRFYLNIDSYCFYCHKKINGKASEFPKMTLKKDTWNMDLEDKDTVYFCSYDCKEHLLKNLRYEGEFQEKETGNNGETFGYIYLMYNRIENKYYVGQTRYLPFFRWQEHIKDGGKGDIEDISFSVITKVKRDNSLDDSANQEILNNVEAWWIVFRTKGGIKLSKNVLERMKDIDAKTKIAYFVVKQKSSYEFKKRYAMIRAFEFVRKCDKRNLNYYVSIGGLDSITLFLFLKSIGIEAPGVSVSSLEDKSIQKMHSALMLEKLKPAKDKDGKYYNKTKIIRKFGFPVLSKEIASKVEKLQNPTEKNKTIRHAIITGETGAYGGYRKHTKMKLSQKWLEKFAGYENKNENVNYKIAPFKLSSKCCYYLKEKPCQDWARKHNAVPFMGLMASEGGRRAKGLMIHGCNYFGKSTIRSAPFAIFNRDDLLKLTLEMDQLWKSKWKEEFEAEAREKGLIGENEHFPDTIIPKIYGEIEKDKDGKLYTTKAQRTGCNCCGFGIQMEKRPHRFDILREHNEKEWHYWMYECCVDEETGEKYGWGKVLDYIGIGWKDMPQTKEEMLIVPGQISIFG